MAATNESWIEHPGTYIKEEMEERGWLQRDLAFVLGCPEQAVNMILSGKRGISPEMAKALGDAFDVPAEFFMNLQQAYDLSQARAPDPSVAVRRNMQATFPVREMIRRSWIESSDASLLEIQLARFFEVKRPDEIPYMPHAARRTRYEERALPPAEVAWLFRVRQIAKLTSVPRYSPKALRDSLRTLEGLLHAPEEARHVPRILTECGVRFILVEKLPNAEIDGVCFWLNDEPVIGMTARRDKIDNFWFVLRHEIEHVLQGHGKQEEMVDSKLEGERASPTSTSVSEEERIANRAAADLCAPIQKLDSFMARKEPYFYEKDVVAFARLHQRHPGLIVGQMQGRMERYDHLARYLVKIRQFVAPVATTDGWGQAFPAAL